jgi:hypothetical protein
MKPSFSFLVLVLVLFPVTHPATLQAAPFTRDLGEGLVYHRITTLPADLPTAEVARKQPCVLDLRYVRGDAAAGTALDAWLKFRATSRTPVLLLINAETAATVLAPLAARLPSSGLVVIGTASPGLTPDLALKLAPAEERRAYDALAAGATVESVLNDSPEKTRDDEARLVKDYARRPDPATSPSDQLTDDFSPAATNVEKTAPLKTAAPPIDSALQRAVHLHRALKALKKL